MKTSLTEQDIANQIVSVEKLKLGKKTACVVVTLRNGFEIVETSAPVDPEKFDLQIGCGIALKRAMDKVWELEGYRLQQTVYETNQPELFTAVARLYE